MLIEIRIAKAAEDLLERTERRADVHDDPVLVEVATPKRCLDDVRRAVQALGGSEDGTGKAVRDHDVVADGDGVDGCSSVVDDVAEPRQLAGGKGLHGPGEVGERAGSGDQRVERVV